MKLRIFMWIFVAGIIAAGGFVLFDRWIRETETANRSGIDDWIDNKLSDALADKLRQPAESILQALRGTPTSEVVKLIDNTVQSVTLSFTRLSGHLSIEIRLDVAYKDGTLFSTIAQQDWDNLPESVRAEFLRSGGNTACRVWEFPWSNMEIV